MGTSSDYTGGTGGNWTSYKHATSNYARHGGRDRAGKVLARYVSALGGAGAASSRRAAGVRAAQRLAGFGAGIANQGLSATLRDLGLGHLIGGSRFDVLDRLLEAFGADGGTLEDQAVNQAVCEAFAELYPDDAETYEELEEVTLDREGLVLFIERTVAAWAYARLLPTLAEKFSHIEDPDVAQQRYDDLRERILLLVNLEVGTHEALDIDWRGDEGETILTRVIDQLYEDMEDIGE